MSDQVHHLSMGPWVVFLAYTIGAVGLTVGIACARRAAQSLTRRHIWTLLAAMVIGGDTYWLANMVTMAGFAVDDSVVRFHQMGVVAALLVCTASALAGLLVNNRRAGAETGSDTATLRMLAGGVVMGLGTTAGYYISVLAIEVQGRTYLDGALTAVAAVIAVLASICMLWLVNANVSRPTMVGVTLVAALGPVLMHVALMAALRVRLDTLAPIPPGGEVFTILFPSFVMSVLILIVPIILLLMAPDPAAARLEQQARVWAREEAAEQRR